MSRPIAYNASGPLSGSIRGGSVNYTVDSGNRDYTTFASKKWVPSADGAAPIVFVTDTYTQGFELNPNLAVPLFYSCNGTGSAAIIYTANRVPGSPGNYSDANVALNDLITARGYFILESNDPFEGVDADGLALDLDAAKMSSYPQVGTNWRDLSGQGNTGALTNGPTWNSNGWFTFDGVDDFVQISNVASLRPPNELTIEMIVRAVSITANWNLLYGQNPYSGGQLVFLETGGTLIRALHFINGVEYRCNTNESISTTVFKHIVFTFKTGDAIRSYFNGTPSTVEFIPAGTFTYNTSNPYYLSYFGGSIPNIQYNSVKSYNKALSQTEIKQNYFGAPIVTDGLVFAVDANNIVSYPKSGTSWFNLTGSAGNGTLTNGPTFNQENGGAIVYDGVDDYVGVSSFNVPYLTVSTWVYKTSTSTNQGISRKENGWAISQYNGTLQVAPGTSWNFYNTGYTIPLNTWVNIVYTYSGTGAADSQIVYINGLPIWNNSAGSGAISPVSSTVWIGFDDNYWYWGGKIATNKIYNRALSAAEVLQNYQAEQYRFETPAGIPTNGLVLNLDASNLDSYPGTGTTWYDLSGTGNNATLYNGTSWNSTGYMSTDAVDDYIQIPNAASLQVTTGFTQVIWVKLNNIVTVSYKNLFGKPNYVKYGMIVEWYGGNPILFDFSVSSVRNSLGLVYPGTSWVMVAQSYNSTGGANNQIGYIRGGATDTIYATRTGNVDTDASPMNIGQAGLSIDVGMALLYNRGLTQTELDQIYNATKAKFGL